MDSRELLLKKCRDGFLTKLNWLVGEERTFYGERMKYELDVIDGLRFNDYFLIVQDIVMWAKTHGIRVGPGRGSVAGSLVAYVLDITEINPIEFDLIFERFLNKDRISAPDIDIDFEARKRGRVFAYIRKKYGEDHVAQIVNYTELSVKSLFKDLGRVLEIPEQIISAFSDMVPYGCKTIREALQKEKGFSAYVTRYKELFQVAQGIEGCMRQTGKHAAGVVITKEPLIDSLPILTDGTTIMTQWEKKALEGLNFLKMDILAVKTLDVIDMALEYIGDKTALPFGDQIDICDPDIMKEFEMAHSLGTFQFETPGMRDLLEKIKPKSFDDLYLINALDRPGAKDSAEQFVKNRESGDFDCLGDERLRPILESTYGIVVYQEQVIRLLQEIGGFTASEADVIRRAISAKNPKVFENNREKFLTGAEQKGFAREWANGVFEIMKKSESYGFNKSVDLLTKVMTINRGILNAEDVRSGDIVQTIDANGDIVISKVVANYDHGDVPMWEILFDDGAFEKCTLDHKWLTEYGQMPLYQILKTNKPICGVASNAINSREFLKTKIGMRPLDLDSHKLEKSPSELFKMQENNKQTSKFSSTPMFLRHKRFDVRRNVESQTFMRKMDKDKKQKNVKNSFKEHKTSFFKAGIQRKNEKNMLSNSDQNFSATRYHYSPVSTIKRMERKQSRKVFSEYFGGAKGRQTIKNGNKYMADFETKGFQDSCSNGMRKNKKTSRFRESQKESSCRNRRALAFSPGEWLNYIETGEIEGCSFGKGDNSSSGLELVQNLYGELEFLRRIYKIRIDRIAENHLQSQLQGKKCLYRRIVQIRYLGMQKSCDLEIGHSAHNFVLASGLCTSNSHSVAYSMLGYQTMWMKVKYPLEFMTAALRWVPSSNQKKMRSYEREAERLGIKVLPYDINESKSEYTLDREYREEGRIWNGAIRKGLSSIPFVGEAGARIEEFQPFSSFGEFYKRVPKSVVGSNVMKALIKAGCFDSLGEDRNKLGRMIAMPIKGKGKPKTVGTEPVAEQQQLM